MNNSIPHKRPNRSTTEADWLQIMQEFRDGATDAELAIKWHVSKSTVAAQRHARGVFRADHRPRPRGEAVEALDLASDADTLTTGDALLAHSRKLSVAGRLTEAFTAARLSRQHFMAAVERRRAARPIEVEEPVTDGDPLPAPPELRVAQRAPEGDWRTWLFLGGRGAGKTLAGAAWLAARARDVGRLALVGPTLLDVREVMIDGPSGLRGLGAAFGPEGDLPVYEPSRRRLVWPNGAAAAVFSAEDPDSLRGPQFEAAWADELCAWSKPGVLAMLRLGLRLGPDPRLMLTTTPKPSAALAALMAEPGLVTTRGSALDNAQHLAPGFVDNLRALYGGTRLERQEIDGEVLEAFEGAVFRRTEVDRARAWGSEGPPGRFDRLVVAVDPPAGRHGAACGIVIAGRIGTVAWVLEDATTQGLSPLGWANRVAQAAARAERLGPVDVVAEANQGGEMVRQVLTNGGLGRPLRLVHATVAKAARAEPVALLYEQGRVAHAPGLEALEDQMLLLGAAGERSGPSPDRADALVWALTALMLEPVREGPRIRVLDW